MRKIFISYRRSETEYAAGALGRELRRRFGDEQVFRDKEDIGGGASWKQQLLHEIDRDCALLVLMGKGWVDVRDSQGRRRLDNPDDGLHLEICDGIKDGAAIIPVLLENAQMPDESELPPDLRRLADFNAIKLRDGDWERDVDTICRTLVRAGFREIDSSRRTPAPHVEIPVTPPVAKKGIWAKSIIAGVLLLFAFAALAAEDLDSDGHLGVAIFSSVAFVLGILTWREAKQARVVGAVVSGLSVIGFLAGIGGMESTEVPPQPSAVVPVSTTPAQFQGGLGNRPQAANAPVDPPTAPESLGALNQVASEVNKNLPMMIDKETELVNVLGLAGVMVYNYRLVNLLSAQIDSETLVNQVRPIALTSACTTPQTRDGMLKKGITMRFSYSDKNRVHIGTFDVAPAACGF